MNELKSEDVMRALDILDKMDFFQGQRAGRELWFEKPFEVQEQDIADFSQGIDFVKNLITNALAFLRENDAEIERLHRVSAETNDRNFRLLEATKKSCEARINLAIREAITEFAERLKTFYKHLPGNTVGGAVEYHIDQIAKEMKEGRG